jgi:hypothetical protein
MLTLKIHQVHWNGNKGKSLKNPQSIIFFVPSAKMIPLFVLTHFLTHTHRYMNFMFDLEDASTDGAIDANEFAIVCSSYGLDKKECEEAFGKMSQVGKQREGSGKDIVSLS